MSQDLVTVASFRFLPEAEASKLLLEAEGLTAFLADAETVSMDWFIGNAIGYIKVQVPGEQAEAAAAVLVKMRESRSGRDEEAEEAEANACLACGAALEDESTKCAACGWSYDDAAEEPEAGVDPTPE